MDIYDTHTSIYHKKKIRLKLVVNADFSENKHFCCWTKWHLPTIHPNPRIKTNTTGKCSKSVSQSVIPVASAYCSNDVSSSCHESFKPSIYWYGLWSVYTNSMASVVSSWQHKHLEEGSKYIPVISLHKFCPKWTSFDFVSRKLITDRLIIGEYCSHNLLFASAWNFQFIVRL